MKKDESECASIFSSQSVCVRVWLSEREREGASVTERVCVRAVGYQYARQVHSHWYV
jgi:hypothetical protein